VAWADAASNESAPFLAYTPLSQARFPSHFKGVRPFRRLIATPERVADREATETFGEGFGGTRVRRGGAAGATN